MNVYEAINIMRAMSDDNIPFSISFVSCNTTKNTSNGNVLVKRCVLRTGMSQDKSDKSKSLIGYTDLDSGDHRWFYIPLLLTLNNINIE